MSDFNGLDLVYWLAIALVVYALWVVRRRLNLLLTLIERVIEVGMENDQKILDTIDKLGNATAAQITNLWSEVEKDE